MTQLAAVGLALASLYSTQHHHKHHHHLPPLQTAEASWYDDSGSTACGFHEYFGVANRTLPCGTKVTFFYRDTAIKAMVDDRGPFVYSRPHS
jgi:rare lipoprotein A (peptidoglycan hydrolase)